MIRPQPCLRRLGRAAQGRAHKIYDKPKGFEYVSVGDAVTALRDFPDLGVRYSGTVGTGASGWGARAERSMAMAAYAMTPVTAQRISVR
jgi:hypothetical protein